MSVAPDAGASSKPGLSSQISGGVGGLGDILGSIMEFSQQQQQDQAMTQTGDELQGDLGALTGEGTALEENYAGHAQPQLNAEISQLPGAIQGYQGGAAGDFGAEAGYGSQVAGEGGLFEALPAGSIASEDANAAQLENWHGLQPKELGEATTVASDAAASAAQTMKAQMGGVANPGQAFEEATNQAAQAGMQTGAQLGAMAQEQELGAKEAAGQEYGAVAGQQLQEASGTVGATEAAGQLSGAAGTGMAGLSEQDIGELESALSEEGTMGQAGMSGQEYGASDWTSLLEQEMGDQQNQGNPFSGMASGLTSLLPLLGVAA